MTGPMSRIRSLTSALALAALVATGLACRSNDASDAATSTSLPDRDPKLACDKAQQGGVILDVRTPEEFAGGHVDGAVNIPVDELDAKLEEVESLTGGDKNKPLIVYCRSGARAGRAKKKLLRSGYTQVTNLGGLSDWPADCPRTGG